MSFPVLVDFITSVDPVAGHFAHTIASDEVGEGAYSDTYSDSYEDA